MDRVCSESGATFDPDESMQVKVVIKVAATPVLEKRQACAMVKEENI